MVGLYREVGERGNEMENSEYERKKEDDLQKRLSEAFSSIHHIELVCQWDLLEYAYASPWWDLLIGFESKLFIGEIYH